MLTVFCCCVTAESNYLCSCRLSEGHPMRSMRLVLLRRSFKNGNPTDIAACDIASRHLIRLGFAHLAIVLDRGNRTQICLTLDLPVRLHTQYHYISLFVVCRNLCACFTKRSAVMLKRRGLCRRLIFIPCLSIDQWIFRMDYRFEGLDVVRQIA